MAVELAVTNLAIRGFRNLSQVELQPGPRFNVFSGDNGQGKTSLLEAIYFLCTSRSFRSERVSELRQLGAQTARVTGQLREAGVTRTQRATLSEHDRELSIDDKHPARLSEYATRTPVVVFQPGDLQLIAGSAAGRRKLLDRVALFLNPVSLDHRQRFQRAQRERQHLLETRGLQARELDGYERVMAEHGAELERIRLAVAEQLERATRGFFERVGDRRVQIALKFCPGGPYQEEELVRRYALSRADDLRRGATRLGPHRDDLEINLEARPARRHASQGQQRILALALKIAELECLRHARGAFPLLLLDDVSSELDRTRTDSVHDYLRTSSSQIFLTTTRPELFALSGGDGDERRDFRLEAGALFQ